MGGRTGTELGALSLSQPLSFTHLGYRFAEFEAGPILFLANTGQQGFS
jgi:hypothetical protein